MRHPGRLDLLRLATGLAPMDHAERLTAHLAACDGCFATVRALGDLHVMARSGELLPIADPGDNAPAPHLFTGGLRHRGVPGRIAVVPCPHRLRRGGPRRRCPRDTPHAGSRRPPR
jgi:hypothetical protein